MLHRGRYRGGATGAIAPPPQAEGTWAVASSIRRVATLELAPDNAGVQREHASHVRTRKHANSKHLSMKFHTHTCAIHTTVQI